MTGNWNYPTSIRFGAGRLAELPLACVELGIKRPLLVTDRGLMRLPVVSDALGYCSEAGLAVGVFCDVRGNPVGENVDSGVRCLRDGGYDGVIALGGGSALDVGKAVALMAHQTRPLWDFEDVGDNWTRVDESAMVPVVAVPTTSGTGSEVGRAAVITRAEDHRKLIIFHAKMLPARVICDPAVTVGLPSVLTAWVGMDALSHNLEALCAPGFHPLAEGIALEGIRLVFASLRDAVRDGEDLAARSNLMAASLMGATAFQKGLGGMHALAHPLGAGLDAHHGLLNAIVMPAVLRFNLEASREALARCARMLGLATPSAEAFVQAVIALRADVGIPDTLAAVGMTPGDVAHYAPLAVADSCAGGNPVPLDEAKCAALYHAALQPTVAG